MNKSALEALQSFFSTASRVLLDKDQELHLAICALLADGHLLIEDIPGVGKTTLVKLLAKLLGLHSQRVQFTNDLLPSDIVGSSIYDLEKKSFVFHAGPIFAELVFADELNRATPKTQSACLQAMEERRVTVDGKTYDLPNPFFVIATQNPRHQIGTFPLPESQLDRFLMRISLGYPSRQAEMELIRGENRQALLETLMPLMTPADLLSLQGEVSRVHLSEAIVEYLQNLVDRTRHAKRGLSPRGTLALAKAAKSWAYLKGRNMVIPEDVQSVAVAVMGHRLNLPDDISGESGLELAKQVLKSTAV